MLVLMVLLLLPWLDLSFARVLPVLQALWGGWFVVALVTFALLVWQRMWVPLAALVVAMAAGLAPVVTAGSSAETDGDPVLTVLSVNLEYSQADPAEVVAAVEEVDPDALVLLEIDRRYLQDLRDAGLDRSLPHGWQREVRGGAPGSTVLSRVPQRDAIEHADDFRYWFDLPLVALDLGDQEVLLRAVHTQPPAPGPSARWRLELDALDAWVDGLPEQPPLVLAGDFNAGRVHPAFRDVVDGFALAPSMSTRTWPTEGLVPPFVGIDHVASRGLVPTESGAVEITGSDHKAVWARLARAAD